MGFHDIDLPCAIEPKAPLGALWKRQSGAESRIFITVPAMRGLAFQVWEHLDGFTVISSVEAPTPEPGHEPLGPEYHISMSRDGGRRCSTAVANYILKAFGISDATEDNHLSGISRHFWRPVADKFSGHVCPCQETEVAIVEDKGEYIWRHAPNNASTQQRT